MRLSLIALGNKMPVWVDTAMAEYTMRYPREWHFSVTGLTSTPRRKSRTLQDVLTLEGEKMLRAAQGYSLRVALDERGQMWTSRQLADRLADWQTRSEDVAFLVGGADGLSQACQKAAHLHWSLSPLTFPHGLVRIILAEQLYRAWSLLSNHPYHRD